MNKKTFALADFTECLPVGIPACRKFAKVESSLLKFLISDIIQVEMQFTEYLPAYQTQYSKHKNFKMNKLTKSLELLKFFYFFLPAQHYLQHISSRAYSITSWKTVSHQFNSIFHISTIFFTVKSLGFIFTPSSKLVPITFNFPLLRTTAKLAGKSQSRLHFHNIIKLTLRFVLLTIFYSMTKLLNGFSPLSDCSARSRLKHLT